MSGLLEEGHAYRELDHLASVTTIVSNIALPWLQQAAVHLGSILQHEGVESAAETVNAIKLTFRGACAARTCRAAEVKLHSFFGTRQMWMVNITPGKQPLICGKLRGPQEPVRKQWHQKISYPWRGSNPNPWSSNPTPYKRCLLGYDPVYSGKLDSLALVHRQTTSTERLPHVGKVNANFWG
jgi:hypothetical protein